MAKKEVVDHNIDPREVIEVIALKDIHADNAWNCRRNLDENASATEEGGGMTDLIESLKVSGQDQPVIVRPMKNGKAPYSLVCGFRRYEALTRLAFEQKDTKPTIKAVVRQLTEMEARMLNVRENTARKNLGAADLCFGVKKILDHQPTITTVALGQVLGISQAYASQLKNIADMVEGPLVEAWRDGVKPGTSARVTASKDDMLKLSKVPRDKQNEVFDARQGKLAAKSGPNAWKQNLLKSAESTGIYFGRLVKAGALVVKENAFRKHLGLMMSVHKDAAPADLEKFTRAAEQGFVKGQQDEPVKEPKAEKTAKNGKAEVRA